MYISPGAEDIVIGHSGKQLYVVLLPEDGSEERKFLEQGITHLPTRGYQ